MTIRVPRELILAKGKYNDLCVYEVVVPTDGLEEVFLCHYKSCFERICHHIVVCHIHVGPFSVSQVVNEHRLQTVQQFSWHYLFRGLKLLEVGLSKPSLLSYCLGSFRALFKCRKTQICKSIFVFSYSIIPWIGQFVLVCVVCTQISIISGFRAGTGLAAFGAFLVHI